MPLPSQCPAESPGTALAKERVSRTMEMTVPRGTTEENRTMRKYVFAWLLGVPVSVLVLIYVVSHVACGR